MSLSLIVSSPGAVGCLPESPRRQREDCVAGWASCPGAASCTWFAGKEGSGRAAKGGSTGPGGLVLDSVGTVFRTRPCEIVKEEIDLRSLVVMALPSSPLPLPSLLLFLLFVSLEPLGAVCSH